MSTWRTAGLNYVNYSNIAAKVLRRSLKPKLREDAIKRGESHIRYFYWAKGVMLPKGQTPTGAEPKGKGG